MVDIFPEAKENFQKKNAVYFKEKTYSDIAAKKKKLKLI